MIHRSSRWSRGLFRQIRSAFILAFVGGAASFASAQTSSIQILAPTPGVVFPPGSSTQFSVSRPTGVATEEMRFFVNKRRICVDMTAPFTCAYTNSTAPGKYAFEAHALNPDGTITKISRPFFVAFTPAGALTNPSLGAGLAGITDWSSELPFLNVMKSARTWTGHLPGRWGGYDHASLAAGGHLDPNGWLRSLPADATHVEALVLTDLDPKAVSAAGRYRLRYIGEGQVDVAGRVSNVTKAPGEIRFDFTPGPGLVGIQIRSTDPQRTGNYIRNITLVKEQYISAFKAGALFNPVWLAKIHNFRSLRFMEWMQTNNSKISTWTQRPRVSDYTYSLRGAPVEVMVRLANEVGADPWFNMPHLADATYMRNFALYVRRHLEPQLKAHVEYSNEVWNFIFDQTHWAYEQATRRWGSGTNWMEFVGMKAALMAKIWAGVYGSQAPQRLVRVIATHTGWQGLEDPLLNAPRWVAEAPTLNRPPSTYFDAYAVTGYFGYELGESASANQILSWIAQSQARAEADADARGLTGADRTAYINAHRYDFVSAQTYSLLNNGSLKSLTSSVFPYHKGVADRYGLRLLMYEGGTHVVGQGSYVDNQTLTAFFMHFNYSTQMGQLYSDLLTGWRQAGGTLFNAFVDVNMPTKWGSWGHLRHLNDTNPRWDTLMNFNQTQPAWWETRQAGTFQ